MLVERYDLLPAASMSQVVMYRCTKYVEKSRSLIGVDGKMASLLSISF